MTTRVEIRKIAVAAIVSHAADAVPHECCGLLIGTAGRIESAARARNIATNPRTRFLVSPEDHFAAIRRARSGGLSVVGAYHSHPRGAAAPSETDRREAFDDSDFIQIIVSPVTAGGVEMAAYCLRDGAFVPIALVTAE